MWSSWLGGKTEGHSDWPSALWKTASDLLGPSGGSLAPRSKRKAALLQGRCLGLETASFSFFGSFDL